MSLTEILLIGALVTPYSAYIALSARLPATQIPWLKVLRHPVLFGGRWSVLAWTGKVLLWCVLANVIAVGVGWLITRLELEVLTVAEVYANPRAGGNPFHGIVLVLVSLWSYLYIARQTHRLVDRSAENLPTGLLPRSTGRNADLLPTRGLSVVVVGSRKGTPVRKLSTRLVFYLIPLLLAPLYEVFYFSTGILLSALAYILIHDMGESTIIGFYHNYFRAAGKGACVVAGRRGKLVELDRLVESCRKAGGGKPEEAFTILIGLLRIEAYRTVRCLIEGYIRTRAVGEQDDSRSASREKLSRPRKVKYTAAGHRHRARIREYSVDGKGLYLSTNLPLACGERIEVQVARAVIAAEVRHREARCEAGDIVSGIGVTILGDDQRGLLLEAIRR